MQAVILVAGNSTRMHPLTVGKHKSLLKVAGKRIIEHQLDALLGVVDEAILVVGRITGEQIKSVMRDSYRSIALSYAVQEIPKGTLHAVLCAEQLLKDKFIVLMGDDWYSANDLRALADRKYGILACEVPNPQQFGVIIVDANKNFVDIVEKPAQPPTNLVSTGAFVLDKEVFKYVTQVAPSARGELELGDAVKELSKMFPVQVVSVKDFWKPCSYPWDLLAINELVLNDKNFQQKISENKQCQYIIESGVKLKGFVSIGDGTIIKSGTYIDGPVVIGKNCVIGPQAHIRGATSIGDNCRIEFSVQVKNSVIGDYTCAAHHAYIGDSVVGDHVNFGNMTTTSNWRNDEAEIKSIYKGVLVPTGRTKFGAVIGDYVKLGCGTIINPGRKLWPKTTTIPNEVVTKDKVADEV